MSVAIAQLVASSQLSGGNAAFVEDLYESYLADPTSVSATWRSYFASFGSTVGEVPHAPVLARIGERARRPAPAVVVIQAPSNVPPTREGHQDGKQAAVLRLINSHRTRGHLRAHIDPLGMMKQPETPDLALGFHGLSEADLDSVFDVPILFGQQRRSLRAIVEMLSNSYLSTIGAEFMHISDFDQRKWFQERLETTAGQFTFDADTRLRILHKLTAAEGLERYFHSKYVGQKRFSLEGGDSLIPLLDTLVQGAGAEGVRDMVIGMAHRGRLNVLINTVGKPPREICDAFEGKHGPEGLAHSGDVKYHLGFSSDVKTAGGVVHLALGFNPSHLEIVNPVVSGSVRARQMLRGDTERNKVVPVLIHGDAAFAGQGVVAELFNMSQAPGYTVGGTIHIVINNQVGFTTSKPEDARSTFYCTDIAKIVNAPVLHVNGDDPEAVVYCAQLAFAYRQTFKRDLVIDLVCYRRHGHNEADEPAATQPLMYQNIRKRKTTRELYAEALVRAEVLIEGDAKTMLSAYRDALDVGLPVVDELTRSEEKGREVDWHPYLSGDLSQEVATGVPQAELAALAQQLLTLPEGLELHPRVAKIYEDRAKMASGDLRMDWGYAETMAYAALLKEGYQLRISGQDAGRGTFFHRHAVLHDQRTDATYMPLSRLAEAPGNLTIIDSLLSEEAVMGFEYGYCTADPNTLTIWEAQFGDFCNGAQVVIDQFLSSGEAKWGRLCGLVLFLPHGYEGQGPEHSSARLERFLQLCALNNMQVCVPTTPAQMFHMLRRQMRRGARKPLVVMTPKSMLRHKLSTSTLDELAHGRFQTLIPDSTAKNQFTAQRVVFCSGKVYYDLIEMHDKRKLADVAIVRVEQLYPFPRAEVQAELARFRNARDIVWCQEEPLNQGAWFQIRHHFEASMGAQHKLRYAGRERSPAPACGHLDTHNAEQTALVEAALL